MAKQTNRKLTNGRRSLEDVVMRLRGEIASERRLLGLYDSPFPDAIERRKRGVIRDVIERKERELADAEATGCLPGRCSSAGGGETQPKE